MQDMTLAKVIFMHMKNKQPAIENKSALVPLLSATAQNTPPNKTP